MNGWAKRNDGADGGFWLLRSEMLLLKTDTEPRL